ncbi:MAG: response regulator transcription factor [Roseivirga sp.]|nr:response regulator transcription factor [Roseivirga sp.]
MIRAIIIDDEKPFINTLRATLQNSEDVMVVGEARSVSSGVTLVNETEPDLVFLDIQMSDGTGFDLLQKLDRRDFRVIFITAHDHFAIEAFKFSAMDYILKPLISDELYRAIEKVRQSMEKDKINLQLSVLMDNLNEMSRDKKRIILREAETMHIIQLDEILWCEADGSYTVFYLTKQRKIMVSKHLKEFEDYLSPNGFFRAHRSHLVNLNKIRKFDRSDGGIIYLQENVALPISVRKKERLAEMLNSMQI